MIMGRRSLNSSLIGCWCRLFLHLFLALWVKAGRTVPLCRLLSRGEVPTKGMNCRRLPELCSMMPPSQRHQLPANSERDEHELCISFEFLAFSSCWLCLVLMGIAVIEDTSTAGLPVIDRTLEGQGHTVFPDVVAETIFPVFPKLANNQQDSYARVVWTSSSVSCYFCLQA